MKYIRRRQIPQITTTTGETYKRVDIGCGNRIKYIMIEATQTNDFSVEINGVEITNSKVRYLTRENGIRFGFDGTSENQGRAILSFEDPYVDVNDSEGILTLSFIARTAEEAYDVTVIDVINI